MGPCLDVYVRRHDRDAPRVRAFLEAHVPAWREPAAWIVPEDWD